MFDIMLAHCLLIGWTSDSPRFQIFKRIYWNEETEIFFFMGILILKKKL